MTLQVTGVVGWRREGLVYKKNEVVYGFLFFAIFHSDFGHSNGFLTPDHCYRCFWILLKVLIF